MRSQPHMEISAGMCVFVRVKREEIGAGITGERDG